MSRIDASTSTQLLQECFLLFHTRQYHSCETLTQYAISSIQSALSSVSENQCERVELLSLHATALELMGDVMAQMIPKPQTRRALGYYRRATLQQFHLRRMEDGMGIDKAVHGAIYPDPNVHLNLSDDIKRQSGSAWMSRVGSDASPLQINLVLKQVQCYLQLELYGNAYHILHGLLVHPQTRLLDDQLVTFELCMQFATLCVACGRNSEAEAWFLKVLKKNPYCIEALEILGIVLHVDRAVVMSALEEGIRQKLKHESTDSMETEDKKDLLLIPLRDLVSAMYADSGNQLLVSLAKYQTLSARYPNHTQLLLKIALLEFFTGDYTSSERTFQRIRTLDPHIMDHMDEYAYLLSRRRGLSDLNRLAQDMLECNDTRPEGWVCLALYHQKKNFTSTNSPSSSSNEKPLHFIDRALRLDVRHAFAHRVRGMLLLAESQPAEAVTSFHYANQIQKDVANYEGLVEAYIVQGNKHKEAVCMAKEAMNIAPKDPRTFTLIGLALSHSPQTSEGGKEKAKRAFRKALLVDPYALRPMFALADMYLDEEDYASAMDLLVKAAQGHGRPDEQDMIHSKLADVYTMMEQYSDALGHYHTAISINSENVEAQRGLERLERLMRGLPEGDESQQNVHGDDQMSPEAPDQVAGTQTNFEQDHIGYL